MKYNIVFYLCQVLYIFLARNRQLSNSLELVFNAPNLKLLTKDHSYLNVLPWRIVILFGTIILFHLDVFPFHSEAFAIENSTLQLSETMYDSINPQFARSNGHVYSSWVSSVNSYNSEIMFKKIGIDSISVSNVTDISNTSGISNIINLKSTKNNIYIIWEDKHLDEWKLLFRKSQDYGESFGKEINLSNATGNVHLHDLSIAGKSVFAVWAANENFSSSNKEIFFRRSLDYGSTFNDTINLSKNNNDSQDPHMITNKIGSIVYIVWTECDIKHDDPICSIVFTRSLDGGSTFTAARDVSNEMQLVNRSKAVFVFNKTVSSTNLNTQYSWSLLDTTIENRSNSINPSIFTTPDGKTVYVLWEKVGSGKGNSDIFISISNDYGKSFNSSINISETPGISRLAHAELLGKTLYVAWSDTLSSKNGFDVMLRKIDNKGVASNVTNLSNTDGNSLDPNLHIKNNKIFVAWVDYTKNPSIILWIGNTSGLSEIKKKLIDVQAEDYSHPLIFGTENKLWIFWTEYQNNKHRIVLYHQE